MKSLQHRVFIMVAAAVLFPFPMPADNPAMPGVENAPPATATPPGCAEKTPEQYAQESHQVGEPAARVARELIVTCGRSSSEAAVALRQAGYGLDETAAAINAAQPVTAVPLTTALKAAGFDPALIGRQLKTLYGLRTEEMAGALLQGGNYTAVGIGHAIQTEPEARSVDGLLRIFKTIGIPAGQAFRAVKEIFNVDARMAAIMAKKAGFATGEIAEGLDRGLSTGLPAILVILRENLGVPAADALQVIAACAHNDAGRSINNVVALLLQASYEPHAVVAAARGHFEAPPSEMAVALKCSLRGGVNDVVRLLKETYAVTEDDVPRILQMADYNPSEMGAALKGVFATPADRAVRLLKGGGQETEDVGRMLHDVYGSSPLDAYRMLKGAGFSMNGIREAVMDIWGQTEEQALQIEARLGIHR